MAETLVNENSSYVLSKTLMRIFHDNAKIEMESRIKKFIHILHDKEVDNSLKSIIERKLVRINNSKIKIDYNIVKTVNSNIVNKDDLNKLVESLLYNAIESCEKIKDENSRWIKINIYEEKNRFLFIDVFNSSNHLDTNSESEENRGRGFEHLKFFLKKYNGDLCSYGNYVDRFLVEIQIPIYDQMIEISLNDSKKYMFRGIPLYNYLETSRDIIKV